MMLGKLHRMIRKMLTGAGRTNTAEDYISRARPRTASPG
jgi:hypothetical protein